MSAEVIATVTLVFAAATAGRIIYERQMDVLHGPYIEGRSAWTDWSVRFNSLRSLADRLRWKMRSVIYLASIAA
jgi:hypothetical protein